ncbi:maleylpyruvate isomerase N-terminal domain-containing protein [Zavarzinella formosa]|uniref:maleylpyruvate isomerase N-terminal domain-containing protein n=1 Tax=Zavarzinella formosa TaxID=360055 RepID=UPI001930BD02|nr:maleylpyruvate isomerase N-terminal domain-containing protein [Zavarzinella formosa]
MPPILVADLFPEITARLVALLRSLTPEEWHLPTVSSRRTVKDIASHLLDGSLRRLSMQRDGYQSSGGRRADEPLMDFLNRLNDEWEIGSRRLSPAVLVELIEWADAGMAKLFQSLDPSGPAIFPVAWAGESQSENWMDVARDYTEKWHHTQQIFDATKRASTITDRHLMYPCLDIFMRALPFTYQQVAAAIGTIVTVEITGESGGRWHIERETSSWRQVLEASAEARSTVMMDQDSAWRLVTKRRSFEAARKQFPDIKIIGDQELGKNVFEMVSVMA